MEVNEVLPLGADDLDITLRVVWTLVSRKINVKHLILKGRYVSDEEFRPFILQRHNAQSMS